MDFMERERKTRLGKEEFAVSPKVASMHALLHLYTGVVGKFRGFEGWERGKLASRPTAVYDLSGLRLFYDFPVQIGRRCSGFIRVAANKIFGDPIVSTQVTPASWDLEIAKERFQKLLRSAYRGYEPGEVKLTCYSYPKLGLSAELKSPKGELVTVIMDVADFSKVKSAEKTDLKHSGQKAYSLLDKIPAESEKTGAKTWDDVNKEVQGLFEQHKNLEPSKFTKIALSDRLAMLDKYLLETKRISVVTQRIIDFCCHSGTCHDHECFCLHPQENNVHCTRASSQMVLCYWRYCVSQHDVAQAFGVNDTALTPWSSIANGLNSLTHNCFTAALNYSVTWAACADEIRNRQPFLSDTGGHTRACAGTEEWRIWITSQPRPRYLYIFDPWPVNTGAVYWENFNTGSYAWIGTLTRKTTSHV